MSADEAGKPSREPGRPQKQVNPEEGPLPAIAQALRDLREACGNPKYRTLEKYAGVPHQRLAEAARGEHLPAWAVVEGYIAGCQSYYQHRHHSPPHADRVGNPARWRQLYQNAGGVLPEPPRSSDNAAEPSSGQATATGPVRSQPARLPWIARLGSRLNRRLTVAAASAVGVVLLTGAAVMIGRLLPGKSSPAAGSTPRSSNPIAGARDIFVTPPAPACGNATADGFRSPATTVFSPVTTLGTLSLDGFSVSTMDGMHRGISYYWVQSHPTGRRAGTQLRWSIDRDHWHYCTATLEPGNIAALPNLVTTVAVPSAIHGQQVFYQTCVWHQQPYTAQCSPVR